MELSAQYRQQLQMLLPPGPAWSDEWASAGMAGGSAPSLARVHCAVDSLPVEADPRRTAQLLPEWEREFGLPDGCLGLGGLPERRAALVARMFATGSQRRAAYLRLARALGYNIEIRRHRCLVAGFQAGSECAPPAARFCFSVVFKGVRINQFAAGGSVSGESLGRVIGGGPLECQIRKMAHAESVVFFRYEV